MKSARTWITVFVTSVCIQALIAGALFKDTAGKETSDAVQVGHDGGMVLWVILLVGAALGLAAMVVGHRQNSAG